MKHPIPSLSLRHLSLFPLLLLIPATAPAAPSPEDIARQQEQRQRQREEQLREHMQPAGHVRLDGGETPVAAPTSGHDAATQPCFPIRRVELTGEGAARFQFALRTAFKIETPHVLDYGRNYAPNGNIYPHPRRGKDAVRKPRPDELQYYKE